MRLAGLHKADRARQRQRVARHHTWHDPRRGAVGAWRQPSRARLSRRPGRPGRPALLHQLGLAALHPPRRHGGSGLRRLSQSGGGRIMTEERAVLAGGCFWGMQDLIRRYDGVISTRVGYTGGNVPNATYRNHGTHAEAIEIIFDPSVISYRTAIFYTNDAQKRIAEDTIADVDASGLWPGKVVTEVAPAGAFWEAEPEHQDYLERYPGGYTCHFVRPGWKLPVREGARKAS